MTSAYPWIAAVPDEVARALLLLASRARNQHADIAQLPPLFAHEGLKIRSACLWRSDVKE
jgi:hypothetical protein